MNKYSGFTLIELLIVVVFVACIAVAGQAAIDYATRDGGAQPASAMQWQEPSKESCVGGYKVATVGSNSFQILDENGNGIKCEVEQ